MLLNRVVTSPLMVVCLLADYLKQVCQGCLSTERRLLFYSSAQTRLLCRILDDESHLARTAKNNVSKPKQRLCWECYQMLLNVYKFQQRVLQAQSILQTFRRNKEDRRYAASLSTLQVVLKNSFDYIEHYSDKSNFYPFQNDILEEVSTENTTETKLETEDTSAEIKSECSDNYIPEDENTEMSKDVDDIPDQDNSDEDSSDNEGHTDSLISEESEPEPELESPKKVEKVVKKNIDEDEDYEPPKFLQEALSKKSKETTTVPNAKYRQLDCKIENIRTKFIKVPMDRNDLFKLMDKHKNSKQYMEAQYKCDKCVQDFLLEGLLECHMNKHEETKDTPYKCDICETFWSTKDLLDMHYRNQHTFKLECLLCGEQLLRKRDLISHQDVMHSLTIECLECGCKFGDRRSFWRHHRELHTTFSCDHCDASYRNKSMIIKHFRNHHRVFKCDECNNEYKSKHVLTTHKSFRHHRAVSEHTYCVECDIQFLNDLQMKFHLKHSIKHRTEKTYACDECGKVYSSKYCQKKHYQFVHLKQYEHCCQICGRYFLTNHRLVRHKARVHDKVPKVKDKVCQHCGKTFSTRTILLNHIRTHTGERPYACEFCPSSFAQKAPMVTHTRRVHNMPDYRRPAPE